MWAREHPATRSRTTSWVPTIPSLAGLLGNSLYGVTVAFTAEPSTRARSRATSICANKSHGIAVVAAPGTVVEGNFIGVKDGAGGAGLGNGLDGVSVTNTDGVTITTVLQGNTIEQNTVDGIGLSKSGHFNIAGNTVRANGADGIRVEEDSNSNTFTANVITDNVAAGIEIRTRSTGNALESNLLGIDGAGNAAGIQSIGVYLNNVSGNVVGGTSLAAGANMISGNRTAGVQITGNNGSAGGNLVWNNLIGLNLQGNGPVFIPSDTGAAQPAVQDVGVFVSNSTSNTISGNIIAGNHTAGVEVSGRTSQGNSLMSNTIGSDGSGTVPILVGVGDLSDPLLYSFQNRQNYGVFLNDAGHTEAMANTVSGNRVLANYTGIRVQGANANANTISGNVVGPNPRVDSSVRPSGLGNFYGIWIQDSQSNTIRGNRVNRNISVGIALVGFQAQQNLVQRNDASSNGGYGIAQGDDTTILLSGPNPGARIFGTGIYVESAQNNIIGSRPTPAPAGRRGRPGTIKNATDGNTVRDNTQVGIYLFSGAGGNVIRGNVITGVKHPGGPWNGDYGILLFNSAGNLPGVSRQGRSRNKITNHRIANFREFTGAVPASPATVTSKSSAQGTGTGQRSPSGVRH